MTNKRNPLIHYNWYYHLFINILLTNNTTCFQYRLKTQYSILSNSPKLHTLLSHKLYQHDGGSKLSIDVISEAKLLRALVNEYLPSTIGSELLLLNKCVWTIGRHLVTVTSLGNNELLMTKCQPIANTIIFNTFMKLTATTAWRWSCSDKKDRNKKTTKTSQLLKWSES